MDGFRSQAPAIAAAMLVWLAALGTLRYAPHPADPHEAAWGAILVVHDASAHRVRPDTSGSETRPLYCLICHYVRLSRSRVEARVVSAPAADAGVRIPVQLVAVSSRAPVAQPPLRSPPAIA